MTMDWWDDPRIQGGPDPDFWIAAVLVIGGIVLAIALALI